MPATDEEALRDLVRAREDLRGDLMRARHRVGKLLLRHDVRFAGNNWTQAHRGWLAGVRLGEPVAQAVLEDGLGSIDALLIRRESLERQMTALVPGSPWAGEVARLRWHRQTGTREGRPGDRWRDSEPPGGTRDTGYPIGVPRPHSGTEKTVTPSGFPSGETRTRTGDTTIFRQMLRTLEQARKRLQIAFFLGSRSSA